MTRRVTGDEGVLTPKEDAVDASNSMNTFEPFNQSVPAYGAWEPQSLGSQPPMPIQDTSPCSHHGSEHMPLLTHDSPLRLALRVPVSATLQALSVLEHIPGIEIVDMTGPGFPRHETCQDREEQNRAYPSHTPQSRTTSPHVLLDFTGTPYSPPQGHQPDSAQMEIPGPYTASLVKRIVEHKHAAEAQMAHIEKLANIGTLASGILHDINNPLYVVLGFSEILLADNNPEEVKDQALEVFQATKRIIKMCEDLNLYARQHGPTEFVPVNLTHQLEEAMKIARFSVGLENMTIERRYAAHPVMLGRPEDIVQIFVNLIINALQAMDGHGILTFDAVEHGTTALISIGDTGPGIPQESMRKIFEPFYTTKPPGKGTGLGLHSVRSLVHRYGGRIRVQSEVGRGTVFHLEFPLMTQTLPSLNP